MRLVLHIGQQKAGSSAIQAAFSAASEQLIKSRVLYPIPDADGRRPYAHHRLGAALDYQELPRGLARIAKSRMNHSPARMIEVLP